ncbi:MAG: hypothetical protein NTY64_17955, partial [Deltaproteobacteria bacterium]|nr:hypothetical protein [Deltaproteobacteria bacterium]
MCFTFVAAAYLASMLHSSCFASLVPRNAGELFTQPSLWRLFTRSSFFALQNFWRREWDSNPRFRFWRNTR